MQAHAASGERGNLQFRWSASCAPRHQRSVTYVVLLLLLAAVSAVHAWLQAWRAPGAQATVRGKRASRLTSVGIVLSATPSVLQSTDAKVRQLVQQLAEEGVQLIFIYDLFSHLRELALGSPSTDVPSAPSELHSWCTAGAKVLLLPNDHAACTLLRMGCLDNAADAGGVRPEELNGTGSDVHKEYMRAQLRRVLPEVYHEELGLVLVLGPVLTLAGFPFWQTRCSEIHHIPDLGGDAACTVKASVDKYFSSMQRFGA